MTRSLTIAGRILLCIPAVLLSICIGVIPAVMMITPDTGYVGTLLVEGWVLLVLGATAKGCWDRIVE